MRIFAVPAALLLACCVYMLLPAARDMLFRLIERAYAAVLRRFTRRTGKTDDMPALSVFLLGLGGALALLGAIHPLFSMVLIAPAFTGVSILPACAKAKDDLDSGKYARDIPAYEALVRETCSALAPSFIAGIIAPMLLCAIGMPLHVGAALGGLYIALQALSPRLPIAARVSAWAYRICERLFVFFLLLCCGTVGRNPLHTHGHRAQDRLLSILHIAPGENGRAPMAGDIAQGVFLCSFSAFILCLCLCIMVFALCR